MLVYGKRVNREWSKVKNKDINSFYFNKNYTEKYVCIMIILNFCEILRKKETPT